MNDFSGLTIRPGQRDIPTLQRFPKNLKYLPKLKDGSIELTFPVASYAEIMMEILKHGSDVEVIKPKSLRTLIKSAAYKIAKIY